MRYRQWGNLGTESFSNLPKITQLVSGWVGFEPSHARSSALAFKHHMVSLDAVVRWHLSDTDTPTTSKFCSPTGTSPSDIISNCFLSSSSCMHNNISHLPFQNWPSTQPPKTCPPTDLLISVHGNFIPPGVWVKNPGGILDSSVSSHILSIRKPC